MNKFDATCSVFYEKYIYKRKNQCNNDNNETAFVEVSEMD